MEERSTPAGFDATYEGGTAPWDIGEPQPALVEAEADGEIVGRVLDIGCGTGENAMFLADNGHEVVGVDLSRHALAEGVEKAEKRATKVAFHMMDALAIEPGALGGRFDTVIDSGFFHILLDEERPRYVQALGRVLHPGGTYHMLVFSDKEPEDWGGPRRVSEDDIHRAFSDGWEILRIRPTRFRTNLEISGHAWHARIQKV